MKKTQKVKKDVRSSSIDEKKKKEREIKSFRYIIFRNNKRIVGTIKAPNIEIAREKIEKKSGIVLSIYETPQGNSPKLKEKELYFFASNFANFLEAGFNAIDALNVVAEKAASKKMEKLVKHMLFYIQRGANVSEAMQLTGSFPSIFYSLIRSGEESGNLSGSFKEVADFLKTMISLKSKISNAIMYPVAVSSLSLVAIVVYMIFVVPSVTEMYDMVGAGLPSVTMMIINTAYFIAKYWWALLIGLILFFSFIRWLIINVIPVKRIYERVKFRIPVVNTINNTMDYLRLGKTFRSAYVGGIPITQTLDMMIDVVAHQIMKDKLKKAKELVVAGNPLWQAFKMVGLDSVFWRSISLGEESGRLDESLRRYLTMTEDEFNAFLGTLGAAIEPVALVVVGIMVGFIVVSLYLPIFQMIPTLLKGVQG